MENFSGSEYLFKRVSSAFVAVAAGKAFLPGLGLRIAVEQTPLS